jgi:hypothetical protein
MLSREALSFVCLGAGLLIAARHFDFWEHVPGRSHVEPESGAMLEGANPLAALRAEAQNDGSAAPPTVPKPEPKPEPKIDQSVAVPADTWRVKVTPALPPVPAGDDANLTLTLDLQKELARLGCYRGRADGRWSLALATAVKDFNARVNAVLPTDRPDYAQLALARSQKLAVCGPERDAAPQPRPGDEKIAGVPETAPPPQSDAPETVPKPESRMSLGASPPPRDPEPSARVVRSRTPGWVQERFQHPLGRQ